MTNPIKLPPNSSSQTDILARMKAAKAQDANWQDGKLFSLVFHAGDELKELTKSAYTMFMSENGLNPTAFPSLKKFESEVISISCHLLGGGETAVGNMTSGGTESILMAVYTAREWARATFPADHPRYASPEIVAPLSVHPAFEKAGHYFGVKIVHAPLADDYRADMAALQNAITPATIMMVGSAPAYPHGAIDPIAELAAIAQRAGILFHVDACVGGFILPFLQRLGADIPPFDLSVPGVTSISADLHKYAYSAKGASVILYKEKALRRHQLFAYMDWPGGIYASPTMGGTRPGGAIASAWAVLNFLGEAGYMAIAAQIYEASEQLRAGVAQIDGIHLLGEPKATIFGLGSDSLNVYEVGDEMQTRGWQLDRQQFPPSLHLTLMQPHLAQMPRFLADLAESVAVVKRPSLRQWLDSAVLKVARGATAVLPAKWARWLTQKAAGSMGGSGNGLPERSAAMYGMLGSLPNRVDLQEVVLDLVEGFTESEES